MTNITRHVPTGPRLPLLRLLLLTALVALTGAFAACGTTEGFGKDVKHLGGDIENSADRNK